MTGISNFDNYRVVKANHERARACREMHRAFRRHQIKAFIKRTIVAAALLIALHLLSILGV